MAQIFPTKRPKSACIGSQNRYNFQITINNVTGDFLVVPLRSVLDAVFVSGDGTTSSSVGITATVLGGSVAPNFGTKLAFTVLNTGTSTPPTSGALLVFGK